MSNLLKKMINKKQSKDHLPLLLQNGKIDLKEVQKFKLYHRLMYGEVVIANLDFTHLKTQTRDWRTYKQEFVFDSQANNLKTSCSCGKKNVFCEHRYAVLEEIIERFGEDFFNEDFVKIQTEKNLPNTGFLWMMIMNKLLILNLLMKGLLKFRK